MMMMITYDDVVMLMIMIMMFMMMIPRFHSSRYPCPEARAELARGLALGESQVSTWFQNQRSRWRSWHATQVHTWLASDKF